MIQASRYCLLVVLTAAAALLLLAGMAHAGHCRVQVRQVIAQPVYAYPVQANVFYSVGEAARFEAILDKKLAALMQQQAQAPAVNHSEVPNSSPASMLTAKCAKCHSGTTPKGGLLLDGSAPLDCETALQAMRAVRDGSMPPKSPLNADDAGVLFSELLDLSKPKE